MPVDWKTEASKLAEALELVERFGGGGPGSRGGKTAVFDALQRYRAAIRTERNEREGAKQTGLFGGAALAGTLGPPYRPSVHGSETSLAAAAALSKGRTENLRAIVLVEITRRPSTDQELAEQLELEENTVRPRRIELVQRGLVRDSGERRPTRSGRAAVVWGLSDAPSGGGSA